MIGCDEGSMRSLKGALIAALLCMGACSSDDGADVPGYTLSYLEPLDLSVFPVEPIVIAHRGGGLYAPENTLLAFQNAESMGADAIELDVRVSGDGDFVVIHDETLDRTTNCVGHVAARSSQSVIGCDAAWWWKPGISGTTNGTVGPLASRGVFVPLLTDVIGWWSSSGSPLTIVAEIKPSSQSSPAALSLAVDRLVNLLASVGKEEDFIVQSSDRGVLSRIKRASPNIRTMFVWSVQQYSFDECIQAVGASQASGDGVFALPIRVLDPLSLRTCAQNATAMGMSVYLWGVERREDLELALWAAVDGVITDTPACMLVLLGRGAPHNPYPPELGSSDSLPRCLL